VSAASVGAAPVLIRHFTDPSCPFAFSAGRQRLRLTWRYGAQIEWETRMIVLNETAPEGVTPEDVATSWERVRRRTGMPIDSRPPLRLAPSVHACRAVVATRLRWPDRANAILRRLRVLCFAGELLDDSDTLELAAEQAGLPVAELAAWADAPEVEAALRADMREARARDCPSYELVRGTRRAELAGLEAIERDAEAAIANLAPELTRRPDPQSVEEVLDWAGMPLATAEVAAVAGREIADVRTEFARVAAFEPVGGDGYWSRG
jgi:2-hydroxychromene-2-carboxylate isomerase